MDLERVRNEELAWLRAGNSGPPPDRLITEAELPDVYHVEHSLEPVVEEVLDVRRKKTNVHYDDGLTEEQWTAVSLATESWQAVLRADGCLASHVQAIEDDDVDLSEVIERNRREQLGGPGGAGDDDNSASGSRTRGNSAVDWDSDTGSNAASAAAATGASLAPQLLKRKRGRPSQASRAESADTGSVTGASDAPLPQQQAQATGKRRKTGKQPAVDDGERARMKTVMDACFEAVEDVDNPDEGHQCAGLFHKLPSKRDYPEYYIMILRPICMDQIRKKIDKGQYRSFEEFIDDFRLMFNNARHYNEDGSTVWKDANYMEEAFTRRFNELTQPAQQLQPSMQPQQMQQQQYQQPPQHGQQQYQQQQHAQAMQHYQQQQAMQYQQQQQQLYYQQQRQQQEAQQRQQGVSESKMRVESEEE